jgi:hypothetical protein
MEGKICCDVFVKLIKDDDFILWMSYNKDDGTKVMVMPYFLVSDGKYRVNNCPSCGKEIRSIRLTFEEFVSL